MALTFQQRWAAYTGPLPLLWLFMLAIFRTLFQCIISFDLYHLINPSRLLARAFASGFEEVKAGFRQGDAELGIPALVAKAHGSIVVEVGAGIGNQIDRLDGARIGRVFAVEPNRDMLPALRAAAAAAGWGERYTVVPYGVDDEEQLERAGVPVGGVDCVLAVQVLCSVPDPQRAIAYMYKLLKPGGELLIFEHLQCKDPVNRMVQRLYNPFWKLALDGCSLDRNTDALLVRAGKWESVQLEWDNLHPEASLFPRVWGKLVKAKN